jgi:hypothetical protein
MPAVNPVAIVAPYYRVGSTLVQRCLHACDNTVIYGEMNSLIGAVMSLAQCKLIKNQKFYYEKLTNWINDVDDDFSCAVPYELLDKSINDVLCNFFPNDGKRYGFKAIGASIREVSLLLHLNFDIVYIHRNLEDSLKSYISQPWANFDNFALARSKSSGLQEFLESVVNLKENQKVHCLQYENIHSQIKTVIQDLGLSIQQDKLEQILSNKINSGYTQKKENDDSFCERQEKIA